MSVTQRIFLCRLVEKMEKQNTYSDKLGLENKSKFHGILIYKEGSTKSGSCERL